VICVRKSLGRLACATVVGLVLSPTLCDAASRPKWVAEEYPCRVAFKAPADCKNHVIVSVPVGEQSGTTKVMPCDISGLPLSYRVVHAGPKELTILVGLPEKRRREHYIYYGAPAGAKGHAASPQLGDPAPVMVGIHTAAGKGVPNTWAKMFYLHGKSGAARYHRERSGFGALELPGRSSRRSGSSSRWLVVLKSYVYCERAGQYRFAIDCRDCGFVLIDGEVAASWPGEHGSGEWHIGPPMTLTAGVHAIDVYNSAGSKAVVEVGWSTPSKDEIVPLSPYTLVCARTATQTRLERKDRSLHPDFSYRLLSSYSILGNPAVFTPVRFSNTTANWITRKMASSWRFDASDSKDRGGNGDAVSWESPVHVFTHAGMHPVTLEVRDGLGFVGNCTKTLDCRFVLPRQYGLDVDPFGLPATCYDRDMVEPKLRITGKLPSKSIVEVSWRITESSGVPHRGGENVTLGYKPTLLSLGRRSVSSLSMIEWAAEHHGVRLDGGRIRFLRPPFDVVPKKVSGDQLFAANGDQLVLVPRRCRKEFTQPALPGAADLRSVTCVDDLLGLSSSAGSSRALRSALVTGRRNERDIDATVVSVTSWDRMEGSYGPLIKLVEVPGLTAGSSSDSSVIILSIGLPDMLKVKKPGLFERNIAALCDILSETMHKPVVLVTPPPYALGTASVRPFAEAITRVGDARAIPVADLYTAFLCAGELDMPFAPGRSLALSSKGKELLPRVIARAVAIGQQRKGRQDD
jgi:hypothetical protein